ncbi:MAG TPA: SDR family oxidoreductase, partial [Chloroflexota bacterium]|nr:SDR family oxidoreductase [Chloroflexota bacterium]
QGARLILTARGAADLEATAKGLARHSAVFALPGDVADPAHVTRLVREGEARLGPVDVLLNNASDLGATPLPRLQDYPLEALERTLGTNAVAPLRLIQLVLPGMVARGQGRIVNVTSDAAVEADPGWGGYGASKAALEGLSRVLGAELEGTGVTVYAVDPGDMDTAMHREAEPGVDLSDLPSPEAVAPAFLRLITGEALPSGRYSARDLLPGPAAQPDTASAAHPASAPQERRCWTSSSPPTWKPASLPKPAASPAMASACSSPTGARTDSSTPASPICRRSSIQTTCW